MDNFLQRWSDLIMEQEIWKDIWGYEHIYQVSNLGRVKSLSRIVKRGHGGLSILQEKIKKFGGKRGEYRLVSLCKNSICKMFKVSRLVAIHFIPNPENKKEVNHKNGIQTDDRVDNLEWNTPSENVNHAFATGLRKTGKGSKNPHSKLTELDVLKIREMAKNHSMRKISRIFNVNFNSIYCIVNRKTWIHI